MVTPKHDRIENRLLSLTRVDFLQYVTEHPKHGSPGTANYIDARTTWFDQAVTNAQQQGITQVVVIAAGFDSRAYRLHSPGLQVRMPQPHPLL